MGLSTWRASWYALSLTALSTVTLGYVVTGVTAGVNAGTGERPRRQNLKDFQGSGPAFDLYIQAVDQFQKDDQADFLSYYEVSGMLST
jgi:tyrosinase